MLSGTEERRICTLLLETGEPDATRLVINFRAAQTESRRLEGLVEQLERSNEALSRRLREDSDTILRVEDLVTKLDVVYRSDVDIAGSVCLALKNAWDDGKWEGGKYMENLLNPDRIATPLPINPFPSRPSEI